MVLNDSPPPVLRAHAVREMKALVVHLNPQMYRYAAGDGNRCGKDIRLKLAGEAGHDPNMLPHRSVARNVEVSAWALQCR